MPAARFNPPVVLPLPDGMKVIDGPRDGIGAMTRMGLGGYDMGHSAWQKAFTALIQATLDPTQDNLEVARVALESLASEAATRH